MSSAGCSDWYRYDPQGDRLVLSVRVQPNASRTGIAGVRNGSLCVRVAAPPIDDRANALLIDFLKKTLELPGGRVMIRRGNHGRTKIIEIAQPGPATLERVKRLAQP
jgi:uncharacterized protein (TIGR00251 family)